MASEASWQWGDYLLHRVNVKIARDTLLRAKSPISGNRKLKLEHSDDLASIAMYTFMNGVFYSLSFKYGVYVEMPEFFDFNVHHVR